MEIEAQTPPQHSPQQQKNVAVGITQAQKQALLDNLQLEGQSSTLSTNKLTSLRDDKLTRTCGCSHRTRPPTPRSIRLPSRESAHQAGDAREPHPAGPAKAQNGRFAGRVRAEGEAGRAARPASHFRAERAGGGAGGEGQEGC